MSRPPCCLIALGSALLFTVAGHATTFDWGGATGNWTDGANWVGGTAPSMFGNAADTVGFANNATSNYTSTYVGQPALATAFNLDKLILSGGATTATGNNVISGNEVFHNLRFVGGGGGIVNSTSNGVGYTVDMAVVVAPPVVAGFTTLNLSGNGTSVVTLARGVLPDVEAGSYPVSIVKIGTSTFELNGSINNNSITSIQEGAIQYGAAAQVNVGLINLGNSSGTADARIILHNNDSMSATGDITVVNSADGGTRTIESTAVGLKQHVNINGDVSINHSGGLIIATGTADLEGPPSVTLAGAISGSGDLIVTGNGRVITSGSMTGFTGHIVVESGSYADKGSLFGVGSTAPVTVGNGADNAGMNFANNGATYAQPITVGAGAGGRDFSVTENGTLTGNITFNHGADLRVAADKAFVIEGGLTGSSGMVKQGAGSLTLSNNTPSSLFYTANTTVSEGTLKVNRDISRSDVIVAGGATLKGSGSVGAVGGAGLLSPGNSPGIMTTSQIDPGGGLDFAFELTRTNANGGTDFGSATSPFNDVARITSQPTPFLSSLGSENEADVYFNLASLHNGDVFDAGFFTDSAADFFSSINGGTFNYFLADAGGSTVFEGVNYSALNLSLYSVSISTLEKTVDFGGGTVNGRSTRFTVSSAVPEPSSCAMLLFFGLSALALRRRRPTG
ncbi:MAG: autotransporter-associated beta strand repeat-containing protein [Verrucomicrobiae bacterium]